jgi:hypothetical protein
MVLFVSAATTTMVPVEDRIHHALRSSNESACDTGTVRKRPHPEYHANDRKYNHADREGERPPPSSINGPQHDTQQNSWHQRSGQACPYHRPGTGSARETHERHDTPK